MSTTITTIPIPGSTTSTTCKLVMENYPKKWKLLSLNFPTKPKGFKEWYRFLIGFDIWIGPVPFLKLLLLIALLPWLK
jgi:hypothetical protein